jgi:Domain of unknown function (DUF4202)
MAELRAIFRAGDDVNGAAAGLWEGPVSWAALTAEFPAVEIRWGASGQPVPCLPVLPVEEWESQFFNFYELDGQLDALAECAGGGPFALAIQGGREELPGTAREILTRCQRLMDRRNTASRGKAFDRVLAKHRQAHALSKPLVRADYHHALDTWQWMLRLEPRASLAAQLAALFHDVERLVAEADVRVEQSAPDYQAFKDAHARQGAKLAETLLAAAGVETGARLRAARLIMVHERPAAPGDPDAGDVALLNDADALSFFSLNSAGYLDYYGPEQTRRKVAFTLGRLRPAARRHLGCLRLRPLVSAALADARRAEARETAA